MFGSKNLLILLRQDGRVLESAQYFLIVSLPGLFAKAQFETVRRYLQAMGHFKLMMKVQILITVLHLLWCYVFILYFRLGVVGAAIATCITYWI